MLKAQKRTKAEAIRRREGPRTLQNLSYV